jgi:flagellar hook-associated protein 3 FlgL
MTSFSRLGSANTYDNAIRNLSIRQSNLSQMQENLTTGKRVVTASDDPTGAAQAERALNRMSRIATDQRALESQRSAITMGESTLGDVTEALQNFRELVVSAGNGAHSAAERKTIAQQLTGLRDQIFSLSNRTDANGQPLFGALGSTATPFVSPQTATPNYTFNGLPGQTNSSEVAIPFALDGNSAFMLSTGNAIFNPVVSLAAVPPDRTLTIGPLEVVDAATVTGSSYQIDFTAVDPGVSGVSGSATVTYNITELAPYAGATPFTSTVTVVPDIPYADTSAFNVTDIPGLKFSLTGKPAAGDTVTLGAISGTFATGDIVTITPKPTSIFSVLDQAISEIGSATTDANATKAVSKALANIDIGMNRVSAVRGQAGDLLNRADRITSDQEKRSIQMEADRSRAEDLDMVKGISDFQSQQTGFQAALQSYAQVQKLSLFNYIS